MAIERLKSFFLSCATFEDKYKKIIELGKRLAPLDNKYLIPENKIDGCQSDTYIYTYFEDGVMHLSGTSDAMISKGLFALLYYMFDKKSAEEVLSTPMTFFEDLEIFSILSPNRSNGLYHMYQRIKNDALKYLLKGSLNNKL